jgi:regulator of nonsense transcripts 2
LPSDSSFAVSMKSQQEAEREEQRRIKNLVLNYDLRDDNDPHDGTFALDPIYQRPLDKNSYAKGSCTRTRPVQRSHEPRRKGWETRASSPTTESQRR